MRDNLHAFRTPQAPVPLLYLSGIVPTDTFRPHILTCRRDGVRFFLGRARNNEREEVKMEEHCSMCATPTPMNEVHVRLRHVCAYVIQLTSILITGHGHGV